MVNLIGKPEFDELQHKVEVNQAMIKDLSKQFDFLRGRVDAVFKGLNLEDKKVKPEKRAPGKKGPRKNP